MATEAQVSANRSNAQKSTGPRTPEGKAVVAQNAVKHGLLAQEGVLRGEDWEEFERHREMLMEQLRPAGALEVILATRIVDLTWRLHRAAQDQNEAFGALYDRHTAATPEPAGPAERGATLGRMILEDFSQDAVLERLLRHERRIEGSLYRTLNELRRVHDQDRKADLEAANTLERWREEDDQARKARAFAFSRPADSPSRPDGGTTNTPRFEVSQPCDIPSWPYAGPAADAPAGDETCETNPICAEPEVRQVPCGTAVTSDSPPNGLRQTNPISEEVSSLKCQVASEESPAASPPTSDVTPETAAKPPSGVTTSRPEAEEHLCETNPIWAGARESQVPGATEVRHDLARNEPGKTNPIPGGTKGEKVGRGRPTYEEPPSGVAANGPEAEEPSCETKPISGGPIMSVPWRRQ